MDGACHLEFMSHDLCSFRPDVVSCVPSDLLATRSPLFSVERPRFFLVLDGSFGWSFSWRNFARYGDAGWLAWVVTLACHLLPTCR